MDAKKRRQTVRKLIENSNEPLSASLLAGRLSVSRQIIVGDVALLRAEGCGIVSTVRGYLSSALYQGRYVAKLACQHSYAETKNELYTIVDLGGHVLNVIVSHDLYGEISGQLGLFCRKDVEDFIERVEKGETHLLSELTDGVHLHEISCSDENIFHQIRDELAIKGLLFNTKAQEKESCPSEKP